MGLDIVKNFVVLSTNTGKTEIMDIVRQIPEGHLYVEISEKQREFDGLMACLTCDINMNM